MAETDTPISVEPRFRINCARGVAFGPGKADLLERIDRMGSIAEAAKSMDMSYMRAWKLVKSLDTGFGEPLVSKVRGGSARGGAELTPTGREALRLYRALEADIQPAVRAFQSRLASLLAD